jgi:hypothetical protein
VEERHVAVADVGVRHDLRRGVDEALALEIVAGGEDLEVTPVHGGGGLVAAVRHVDRERRGVARRRRGVGVPHEVEARAGVRVLLDPDPDRRIAAALVAEIVGLGQVRDRREHVRLLLEDGHLLGQLALLVERGAVVVGGVDDVRIGLPAPARAAEGHVDVLDRELVLDVVVVEHPLERRPGHRAAAVVARPAPRVERSALELAPDEGPLSDARAQEAVVGHRGERGPVAVEPGRIRVGPVQVGRAGARRPAQVAALVVVEQRDRDAVGAGRCLELLHVDGVVAVVLVLDLEQHDRAAAVGDLVTRDDRVDVIEPLLPGRLVVVGLRAGAADLRGEPARIAAGVELGVDVRAGSGDDVQADLLGDVEQPVHVAHAGEVVHARRGGVVRPAEVERHRVEAGGPELLELVAPQIGAGQPEVVELGRPQPDPLAVDHERVPIVGDGVAGPVPGGGRAAGRPSAQHRGRENDRRKRGENGSPAHGASTARALIEQSGSGRRAARLSR